jgi:hypothetical protein
MRVVLILRNDDNEVMFGKLVYSEFIDLNIFKGTFLLNEKIDTKQSFLQKLIETIREVFK